MWANGPIWNQMGLYGGPNVNFLRGVCSRIGGSGTRIPRIPSDSPDSEHSRGSGGSNCRSDPLFHAHRGSG